MLKKIRKDQRKSNSLAIQSDSEEVVYSKISELALLPGASGQVVIIEAGDGKIYKVNVSDLLGASVPDGTYGDIVVSSGGSVWTIGTGVVTVNKIATNAVVSGKIADNNVGNTKLTDMASGTIKGRVSAGVGNPTDLTATEVTALLNTFTAALKGLVPASSGGVTNFLRADGTWASPGGVKKGESAGITGSLNGGTNYVHSFTVSGALLDDHCNGSVNKAFYDDIVSSAQDLTLIAAITANDTGETLFRIDSFLSANSNRKTRVSSF
ncbi:MAG: hypothetical protein S4CHLAM20_04240 [Chlamydiia bacterium]|nr:hypothetical protein [Chlamydiia bacterium]